MPHLLDPVHNALKCRLGFLLARCGLKLPILLQCVCVVGVGICKVDAAELRHCSLDLPQSACKGGPCCKQLFLNLCPDGLENFPAHTLTEVGSRGAWQLSAHLKWSEKNAQLETAVHMPSIPWYSIAMRLLNSWLHLHYATA